MDIFFTSVTEGKTGNDLPRIYMPMNTLLKERLGGRDYGPGLQLWFLMFVLVAPGFPGADDKERVTYKKKDRSTDLRLFLDFAAYKAGDAGMRQHLVYDCMMRSLHLLAAKKIPDFDSAALIADVEKIGTEQGWTRA
ncbi:MAG: Imm44 family immunity protein [Paracoccus sp. (in: a-proteobacteria)]|jgi:hypothetical protein|uniref:Imm44 family immunity protein n=1 Tax=Paracoccus sp. TaxID=267 RepID=UPI0035AF42B2